MNKTKKSGEEVCLNCSELIDLENDHHTQLHTINRPTQSDHCAYFHFNCWVDYFNTRVKNKANATIRSVREKAVGLFNSPMIKSALQGVAGGDVLSDMLNMPLQDKIIPKEEIIYKIQNDRKRKPKGKSKRRKAKKHRCSKCNSLFGYMRIKANQWVCRMCSHVEELGVDY